MNSKIKVMVADDNRELINALQNFFTSNDAIEFVGAASNGKQCLQLLPDYKPDVLLLDIIMPHLDGLAVLEEMSKSAAYKKTKVIMLTAFGQENVMKQASELGATYFMLKPFDFKQLVTRIEKCVEVKKEVEPAVNTPQLPVHSLDEKVKMVIREVGVPPHIKGYHYIREAILLANENRQYLNSITKLLYPQIAKKHNTTPSGVERAIRHAIEVTWNRLDKGTLQNQFGYSIDYLKKKPTNSEFITMLVDKFTV